MSAAVHTREEYLGPVGAEPAATCPLCGAKAWAGCLTCGWEQWTPPDDPQERRTEREAHDYATWLTFLWTVEARGDIP